MKTKNSVHVDNDQFYFMTPDGWGTLPVSMYQVDFVLEYINQKGEDISFTGEYLGWLVSRLYQNVVDK